MIENRGLQYILYFTALVVIGSTGFYIIEGENWSIIDSIYMTIITISTVGFGEMLPIGPIGKSVMIFEGIAGGLVLAILIIALYKKTMDR